MRYLLLLLLLTSCVKTEVIHEVLPQQDTVMMKKPHKPLPPAIDDTTRVQIGWSPTVEDWDNTEVDM